MLSQVVSLQKHCQSLARLRAGRLAAILTGRGIAGGRERARVNTRGRACALHFVRELLHYVVAVFSKVHCAERPQHEEDAEARKQRHPGEQREEAEDERVPIHHSTSTNVPLHSESGGRQRLRDLAQAPKTVNAEQQTEIRGRAAGDALESLFLHRPRRGREQACNRTGG